MRFSRSNTFYGGPTGTLTDWRTAIQQNVQRHQVAEGQPAVFTSPDPVDGSIWYVEVTLQDFLTLFPDPVVEPMEAETEPDLMEVQQATNTYGLDDNCHYVTAAALLGVTVEQVFNLTGLMQTGDDTEDPEISALFVAAGLSGVYYTYDSYDDMEAGLLRHAAGQDRRFAVSYGRADGTGHVVVGTYSATTDTIQYLDYQAAEGEDVSDDVADAVDFALYPQ